MTFEELSKHERRIYYGTYQTNQKIRNQIDGYMEKMAVIETNLGIDSTDDERKKARNKQLILLSKIKELDEIKYDILKKVI
tara:strand:- start:833 stop:1075 length:243 start_codon:yes stop_codon:yes gene_type:complete